MTFEVLSLYRLFVGLNDQKTKKQEIREEDAMKIVNDYIWSNLSGGTVYSGFGVYKHDDGTVVKEKSIVIELFYISDEDVEKFVKHLKRMLNQESVTVIRQNAEVTFA